MVRTSELIEDFAQFARAQVSLRGENLLLDDLFDEWRILNPPSDDWNAIQASLRDVEHGVTARPFAEFAEDFSNRNGLRNNE